MAAIDETEFQQSFDMRIWRRLGPYLKDYRGVFAFMIGFNLLSALVDVLIPLFQRYAVSSFISAGTLTGLGVYAAAYALVIVLQTLCVVVFCRSSMHVEMYLGRDLKRAAFYHLQTLSFSYYNVTPVGYLLSRVMSDTNRISAMMAWNLTDIMWSVFYVLGVFAAMLALNVRLALPVMVIVPLLALITWYFQNRILFWNRKVRKLHSRITGAFNEGITGASTVKTLGIERRMGDEFADLTGQMRLSGIRAARLSAVYIPLSLFITSAAVSVILWRGGILVTEQVIEIATLSAFVSYAIAVFEPIQNIAANIAELISLQSNIERVTDLLDQKPQVSDSPEVTARYGDAFTQKRENWETLVGEIDFEDVSFRYPDGDADVLSHFSLHIPAGSTIAIVGETGAGKSTLVNLACRFFEPTGGRILIDGRDYRERSQSWLHANLGYVMQDPHLFSGTVRENIRYGRLEATDAEVEAAAHAVRADDVIARLEKGWDSEVGEGGSRLSTGEKQLLSFARAVLADPRIIVLDEATASIDTQTEQLIQQAIDVLLAGRTAFLIAHRLSTIRKADLILVVRDGHVVEQGTHTELLRQGGYYAELYTRQFAEEQESAVLGAR